MWKSDHWRLYHIGDFFVDLALDILGGEKTPTFSDSGDINNWPLDVFIEVKGCSNRNTLKIYSKQLDAQIDKMGFPLGSLWYAIFFYRNRWRDKTRNLSKETKNKKDMDGFLGRNIMTAFVLDAKVLTSIRKIKGVRMEQRNNEIAQTVKVSKNVLGEFVKNPKQSLKKFKLRDFSIINKKIKIKFRNHLLNFNIVFIVPSKNLNKIFKNVFQLNLGFKPSEIEEK